MFFVKRDLYDSVLCKTCFVKHVSSGKIVYSVISSQRLVRIHRLERILSVHLISGQSLISHTLHEPIVESMAYVTVPASVHPVVMCFVLFLAGEVNQRFSDLHKCTHQRVSTKIKAIVIVLIIPTDYTV